MPRKSRRSDPRRPHRLDDPLRSKLRLFGVALLGAKVALVPLLFDPTSDMPFVVPKVLVSHAIAWVLAGTILALFVSYRRAFLVRSWLHIPVLAFVLANIVATVFAVDVKLALYGTHARMLGLASILDGLVLYLAIVLLVRTRAEAVALIVSVFTASAFVLMYETVQVLGRDPYRWSNESADRPFSTLGQATALAQYLMVLAVGAVALALTADRVPIVVRAMFFLLMAALLVGAISTGTRSAIIGLGAGGGTIALLIWIAHPNRRVRLATLVGTAMLTAVAAGVLFLSPLGARIAATIENERLAVDEDLVARLEPSAAARVALYGIGFQIARERPLFGYGPDNFAVGVPRYRPEPAPQQIRQGVATSAHSWLVQVVATSGLVGLGCFIAMCVSAFALTLRAGFSPLALMGAAVLASFLGTGLTTVNEFGTEWLFWASLGIVASAASRNQFNLHRQRLAGKPGIAGFDWTRTLIAYVVLASCVTAALIGASAVDASRSAQGSKAARLAGRPAAAIDLGLRAVRSDPGRAEYWHTLGLAYVANESWTNAIDVFDRASRLAPYNASFIGDLAAVHLILAQSGSQSSGSRARQLGDQVVEVDPHNPLAHLTRATVLLVLRDFPEAVRSFERAWALDPNSLNSGIYSTGCQIMREFGRLTDAITIARQGLARFGVSSTSVPIRVELARSLVAAGKPQDAVTELETALAIRPNEPTVVQLLDQIRARGP